MDLMSARSAGSGLVMTMRVTALVSVALLLVACGEGAIDPGPTVTSPTTSVSSSTSLIPSPATTRFPPPIVSIPPAIEPITGYGDFSGQEYFYVDWFLVTRLTVQCLQDHGFPVTLVPPGDGISFLSVPHSQNQLAQQHLEACHAGLNLPEFEWPSPEQIEVMYRYYVALRECLIAEGYTVSEPPSLDQYIDSFTTGPWSPYENVPGDSGWDAIQMKCPQGPPGGWASWEPGDPIIPITPPDS